MIRILISIAIMAVVTYLIRFLPQKQQHIQLLGVEVQPPLPEQRQELFTVLALPQRRILLCQLVELLPQLLVGVRFPVEFGGLRKGELFLLPRPVHRNCPFRAPALSSADGILPFPETA